MRSAVQNLRRVIVALSLAGVAYVFLRFEFTTQPPGLLAEAYDVDAAPRIIVDRRPRPFVPGDLVVFSDANGTRLIARVSLAEGEELTLVPAGGRAGDAVEVSREFVHGRVIMTFEAAP